MLVRVHGDEREIYISSLKEFLATNDLESEIEIDFQEDSLDRNSLEIEIKDTSGFILISCAKLNFKRCLRSKDEVNGAILECCGFKEIRLIGMRVKDSNNNKIQPEIRIFTHASIKNKLPVVLEYTKRMIEAPKDALLKQKIYFDSGILKSILECTNICFKDSDRYFELTFDDTGGYFVKFTKQPLEESLDHLLDTTLLDNLSKHMKIAKKHPVFECFLNGKIENLVFNKRVLGKIKNNSQDLKNLLEFVEHAHKFQDGRDEVVSELKEFVSKTFPPEFVNTYQYLHVFKHKLPKVKNVHCLKNFDENKTDKEFV